MYAFYPSTSTHTNTDSGMKLIKKLKPDDI